MLALITLMISDGTTSIDKFYFEEIEELNKEKEDLRSKGFVVVAIEMFAIN